MERFSIIFLVFSCFFFVSGWEVDEDVFRLQRAKKQGPLEIEIPPGYNLHLPPPLEGGKAVGVKFSVLLFNVFDIRELQGDVSVEVNLKIGWKDLRLANLTGVLEEGQKYVVLNPDILKKIWTPDQFIDHMKSMSQPALLSKAASFRIYPDGTLRYSARMLIVLSCRMDFFYYPADTQECLFDIKSYAYSTEYITLSWENDKGPELAYPIHLHNFDVAVARDPNYLQMSRSANYSGIRFTLFLRRKLSYHIIQTFIPSALFTTVSWLSFLVPPESTPGRMSLCVTTLLTLAAMFAAVRQSTPSVSYIKALDLWMVTCIIFVFSVLAEYTIVLKLRSMKESEKKNKKKKEKLADKNSSARASSSSPSPHLVQRKSNFVLDFGGEKASKVNPADPLILPPVIKEEKEKGPNKYFLLACKFEKYAPRIMPIAFLIFNLIYWPYLLLCSDYYKLIQADDMYFAL